MSFKIYNDEVVTVELFEEIERLQKDADAYKLLVDHENEDDKIISRDRLTALEQFETTLENIKETIKAIKLYNERVSAGIITDTAELDKLNDELENYL